MFKRLSICLVLSASYILCQQPISGEKLLMHGHMQSRAEEQVLDCVTKDNLVKKIILSYLKPNWKPILDLQEWCKEHRISCVGTKAVLSPNEDYAAFLFQVAPKTIALAVYDIRNEKMIQHPRGEYGAIAHNKADSCAMCISPSGNYIATGADQNIRIWDTKRISVLKALQIGYKIEKLTYSPCETYLALAGEKVYIWDQKRNKQLKIDQAYNEIIFSPNSTLLLCYHTSRNDFTICELVNGKLDYLKHGDRGGIKSAQFSFDNAYFITAIEHYDQGNMVKIWNTKTLALHKNLPHKPWVWSVSCSPISRIVATAEVHEKQVHIWHMDSGHLIMTFKQDANDYLTNRVQFSPDGQYVIVTSAVNPCQYRVYIYDVYFKREISCFSYPEAIAAVMSKDNRYVLSSERGLALFKATYFEN